MRRRRLTTPHPCVCITIFKPAKFSELQTGAHNIEAALDQLRREGYKIRGEDAARLSPLVHDHINVLGRYSFSMPEAVAKGELRPLRNPADDPD